MNKKSSDSVNSVLTACHRRDPALPLDGDWLKRVRRLVVVRAERVRLPEDGTFVLVFGSGLLEREAGTLDHPVILVNLNVAVGNRVRVVKRAL